jgi:Fur family zinc uptake transcriptional regulator
MRRLGRPLTAQRTAALRSLATSPRPLNAKQIKADVPAPARSTHTVHKWLDDFVQNGFAHYITAIDGYVACHHWRHFHTPVFLICEKCRSVVEFLSPSDLQNFRRTIAVLCQAMGSEGQAL